MTVRKLLYASVEAGGGSRQAFDDLINVLLALQGSKPIRWAVQCAAYRPQQHARMLDPQSVNPVQNDQVQLQAKDLYSVNCSTLPTSSFLISRSQHVVIEGDAQLQQLVEKLHLYQQRSMLHLEGYSYTLGDFCVGVAQAVQKPLGELRGLVLDVAYTPISNIEAGEPLLQEFCAFLQEEAAAIKIAFHISQPQWQEYRLHENHSHLHSAVQFVQLMTELLA